MKIIYVKLKNFVGFKSALAVHEIELDLSNSNNRVILLTGENGSGKTTLLSSLHPFANNGSIDIRSDNSLIISGKEGYKEIHYLDETDSYVIKHFYSPKSNGNHTVKSYIEKNGIELNPNGNVTSFRELVKQELDMDQDYLKLMRLGTNVSGFIDAKSTERKAYIGKILEDIDLFLKYHKQTVATVRELKSIISHTSDKLNKLGISDADTYKKMISDKEVEFNKLTTVLEDYKSNLAIVNNELNKLDPKPDELSLLKEKMKKVDKKLKTNMTALECQNRIDSINSRSSNIKTEIMIEEQKRDDNLNKLSNYYTDKDRIENKISSIETSERILDVKREIRQTYSNISTIIKEYPEFSSNKFVEYDISVLEKLISIIMTCIELGDNIKSYNKDSFILLRELYKNSINVKSYINEAYIKLEHNEISGNSKLKSMINELSAITLTCNNSDCPLFRFWNKYKKDDTDIVINELENREFYDAMSIQYNSLCMIENNIKNIEDYISILPVNLKILLNINTIMDNIVNFKDAIDLKPFNNTLSKMTQYDFYKKLNTSLIDLEERLKLIEQDSKIDYYQKQLNEIVDNIKECDSFINDIRIKIKNLHNKDESLIKELDELNELIDIIKNKETYEEQISLMQKDVDLSINLKNKYKSLTMSKCAVENQVNNLSSDLSLYKLRLSEYKNLTKDMKDLSKKLDLCLLIQRSLSTKEGMPLKFIENYFNSANDLTNELLYSVYGDDLQIERFNINSDSFTIPYTVRNVSVPDVMYSSQGEKSFISIALSFALATQNLSKYNIMLLDEVDSPLDTSNREKFINIIEAQCDLVDAEQIFLISHNNMFNMYPVDVINMKNNMDRNMQLASYVEVKTG